MDNIIEAFLSWQFLFFCLAIYAVVYVIRTFAEYLMANWAFAAKESKLWRDAILPTLPIILGQLGALSFVKYPYPEGFSSRGGRIAFGLVAGFSANFVARIYKSFLSNKITGLTSKVSSMVKGTSTNSTNAEDSINKDQ